MSVITVDACKCDREECGHVWIPADSRNLPQRCAKCKSPAWNKANGRPRRSSPAPIVKDTPTVYTPKVQEAPSVQAEELPPIEKHSPVRTPKKPWKEVKAPAGKKKLCPHGFAIVSGVTACARCK